MGGGGAVKVWDDLWKVGDGTTVCVCMYFPQLVVVNVGVHVCGYFVDTPRPKGLPVTYFLAG